MSADRSVAAEQQFSEYEIHSPQTERNEINETPINEAPRNSKDENEIEEHRMTNEEYDEFIKRHPNVSPASPLVSDYEDHEEESFEGEFFLDRERIMVQMPRDLYEAILERNGRNTEALENKNGTIGLLLEKNDRLGDENLDLRLKIQAYEKQNEALIKLAKLRNKSKKIRKEDHSMGYYDKLVSHWRLIHKCRKPIKKHQKK